MRIINQTTETAPIDTVRPHPQNPRQGDIGAIHTSITTNGFYGAIIAQRSTGFILAGNHRWQAARQAGATTIPITWIDVDDEHALRILLVDNRTNDLATYDNNALAELLQQLHATTGNILGTGYDDDDLDQLLADLGEKPEIIEDEVPAPPEVPITQPGDLWLLGGHRLLCGDSTKAEDVERLMDGARITMAFTSPPYASQRKYDESSGFRPIPPDEYVQWFSAIQSNVRHHCQESASWFVNIKEHAKDGQRHLYVKDLAIAHVRKWQWLLVDELCWYKKSLPGQWPDRFRNDWEPIFHFATSKGFVFDPLAVSVQSDDAFHYVPNSGKTASGNIGIGKKGGNRSTGLARPGNVLEISTRKVPNGIAHEAAFPPDLPAFFIKAYSRSGDNIYDPFLGSGTTLIAAEQLGRKCYGMEISPTYCDVTIKRWETLTGKKATLKR